MWGADMGQSVTAKNLVECAGRCMEREGCKAATFNTWDKKCSMKYKEGGKNGPTFSTSALSVNVACLGADPHDWVIGDDNYCRNPNNSPEGPWCYTTDPGTQWESCDVPVCSQDVDCYVEEGQSYGGSARHTAQGLLCDTWKDTGDNYCRNEAGSGMSGPWCWQGAKKEACAVDRCERDCGDPDSGLWGHFLAKKSALCMEVAGWPHDKRGDNVQLYTCENPRYSTTDNTFRLDSDGFLVNRRSNMCVNPVGAFDKSPGTDLVMWNCQRNMKTDQKWEMEWSSFDTCAFRIKNKASGHCVDPGKKTWRDDYRCGRTFPLADGSASGCDPRSSHHCCSNFNWCDQTAAHCDCKSCTDYKEQYNSAGLNIKSGDNLKHYRCEEGESSEQWFYFLPTEDRICSYSHVPGTFLSSLIQGHSYFLLASAQRACSRMGERCGGVSAKGTTNFSLREGTTALPSTTGYGSWVKGDCKEKHYHYFEQQFN